MPATAGRRVTGRADVARHHRLQLACPPSLLAPDTTGSQVFSAPSRCSASATAAAIASSAAARFLLGAAAAACAAASGPGSTRWHSLSTASLACASAPGGAACSAANTSPMADCAARRTLARPSRHRLQGCEGGGTSKPASCRAGPCRTAASLLCCDERCAMPSPAHLHVPDTTSPLGTPEQQV